MLNSDRYEEEESIKFYCTPPLRPSWHAEVLWKSIGSGDLHVIGSDHTAFNYAGQKDAGNEDLAKGPRGFIGAQERLSALYVSGVQSERISLNRFVELVSTNPAKLFGLYPKKGTLAVGSDADMVIFDPKAEITLSKDIGLSRADYSPYEGIRVQGSPWLVLQRGKVIAREGKVMGRPGGGEYIPRQKYSVR
jgi:dihydropyrimidinase